jgi:hypothetical protein
MAPKIVHDPCRPPIAGVRIVIAALLLLATLTATAPGPAGAFHAGGVGPCNGCHTIHNSPDNPKAAAGTSRWLLKSTDPSSICLNCHAGPGSPASGSVFSADGSAMTPGGDFYWLKKTFSWATGSSPGASHGHNVVARDFGLDQDSRWSQAPGGSYPAASLACTSCHDPHGKVNGGTAANAPPVAGSGSYGEAAAAGTTRGNYRLLGDARYNGGQQVQGYSFIHAAPVAAQNPLAPYGESDSSHPDYGVGMSAWCANCHQDYLLNGHAAFSHPVDGPLGPAAVSRYNSYVKTGDLSGQRATAYLQFVPFERGSGDRSLLDPTGTAGPDGNSRIVCLTCHRAHASAFRAAGRWDLDAGLLANSHPALGDGGVSGNDVSYSYYGRDIVAEFGSSQKNFCDKCHAF